MDDFLSQFHAGKQDDFLRGFNEPPPDEDVEAEKEHRRVVGRAEAIAHDVAGASKPAKDSQDRLTGELFRGDRRAHELYDERLQKEMPDLKPEHRAALVGQFRANSPAVAREKAMQDAVESARKNKTLDPERDPWWMKAAGYFPPTAAGVQFAFDQHVGGAQERFLKGEDSEEDRGTLAAYALRLRKQADEEAVKGNWEKARDILAHLPGQLADLAISGGPAKGVLGKVALQGLELSGEKLAGRMAPQVQLDEQGNVQVGPQKGLGTEAGKALIGGMSEAGIMHGVGQLGKALRPAEGTFGPSGLLSKAGVYGGPEAVVMGRATEAAHHGMGLTPDMGLTGELMSGDWQRQKKALLQMGVEAAALSAVGGAERLLSGHVAKLAADLKGEGLPDGMIQDWIAKDLSPEAKPNLTKPLSVEELKAKLAEQQPAPKIGAPRPPTPAEAPPAPPEAAEAKPLLTEAEIAATVRRMDGLTEADVRKALPLDGPAANAEFQKWADEAQRLLKGGASVSDPKFRAAQDRASLALWVAQARMKKPAAPPEAAQAPENVPPPGEGTSTGGRTGPAESEIPGRGKPLSDKDRKVLEGVMDDEKAPPDARSMAAHLLLSEMAGTDPMFHETSPEDAAKFWEENKTPAAPKPLVGAPKARPEPPPEKMTDEQLHERLGARQPIEGLSEAQSRDLYDHVVGGKTLEEVGRSRGVSKQAIEQSVNKALQKLHEKVVEPGKSDVIERPDVPVAATEATAADLPLDEKGKMQAERLRFRNPYERALNNLVEQMRQEMEDAGGKLPPDRVEFYDRESGALYGEDDAGKSSGPALRRAIKRDQQAKETRVDPGAVEAGGQAPVRPADAPGGAPGGAAPEGTAGGAGEPEASAAGRGGQENPDLIGAPRPKKVLGAFLEGQPTPGAPVAEPPPVRGEPVDPAVKMAQELSGEDTGAGNVSQLGRHAKAAYGHLKRTWGWLSGAAGKLGGEIAPQTSRIDPEAGNAIAHLDASRGYAQAQAEYWPERILGPGATEEFSRKVGTAILEERARDAKDQLRDRARESFNAATEAWRKSQTANTPEEQARLLAASERHKAEGKKDQADYQKIITFVGHPDSPFKTEADYQAARADPKVKEAIRVHDAEYVPVKEKNFRENEGLDDADPIRSVTQRKAGAVSAYVPEEEGGQPGPGTRGQGYLGNPKIRKLSTSREASLQGKSYETDLRRIIAADMTEGTPKAAKAEMARTLVEKGLAKWGMNGQTGILFGDKPGVEFPEVAPPKGTQTNQLMGPPRPGYSGEVELGPGQKALFVHPDVAPEVRQVLKVDEAQGRIPYVSKALGLVTTGSLVGAGGEITTHTSNLLGMLTKAGLNPADIVRRINQVRTADPQMQKEWMELSRIGATKATHGMESGDLWSSKYNPLTLSGRGLDFVDKVMRLSASDAFDRLAGKKGLLAKVLPRALAERVEDTEQNKRDFINQLGNYSKGTQSMVAVWLRNSGVGSFATAGLNYMTQGVRAVKGSSGVKARTLGHAVGLRAETYARLLVAPAMAAAINYALWKNVFGDDNTPVGAIKTGEDKETGETTYLDLTAMFSPLRRGMKMTGLNAVMEGTRAGASKRSIKTQAGHEFLQGTLHPAVGPGGAFAYTAFTGKDAIGRQVAYRPDENSGEPEENAKAALKGVSPLYPVFSHHVLGEDVPHHEHLLRESLGPYGLKSRKKEPGQEQKIRGLRRPN